MRLLLIYSCTLLLTQLSYSFDCAQSISFKTDEGIEFKIEQSTFDPNAHRFEFANDSLGRPYPVSIDGIEFKPNDRKFPECQVDAITAIYLDQVYKLDVNGLYDFLYERNNKYIFDLVECDAGQCRVDHFKSFYNEDNKPNHFVVGWTFGHGNTVRHVFTQEQSIVDTYYDKFNEQQFLGLLPGNINSTNSTFHVRYLAVHRIDDCPENRMGYVTYSYSVEVIEIFKSPVVVDYLEYTMYAEEQMGCKDSLRLEQKIIDKEGIVSLCYDEKTGGFYYPDNGYAGIVTERLIKRAREVAAENKPVNENNPICQSD